MARKGSSASKFSLIDDLGFEQKPDQEELKDAGAGQASAAQSINPVKEQPLHRKEETAAIKVEENSRPTEDEELVSINLRVSKRLRRDLRLRYAQTGEATTQYIRRLIEADLYKGAY